MNKRLSKIISSNAAALLFFSTCFGFGTAWAENAGKVETGNLMCDYAITQSESF